jgi:hypothetical protein
MAGQPLRILKGGRRHPEVGAGVNCYVAYFFTKL